jgi:hypothetical protein
VLLMGLVNLFADTTCEGGASINTDYGWLLISSTHVAPIRRPHPGRTSDLFERSQPGSSATKVGVLDSDCREESWPIRISTSFRRAAGSLFRTSPGRLPEVGRSWTPSDPTSTRRSTAARCEPLTEANGACCGSADAVELPRGGLPCLRNRLDKLDLERGLTV